MKPHDYYYLAKKNLLPGAEHRHRVYGTIAPGSKVHVSAACGKAMASTACMLQEAGCVVTGSDSKFSSPMSDVLDAHYIEKLPFSIGNLENIDLLVAGNALAYSSLEVSEARARHIPTLSGSEAVAQIFKDKRALVVAGTHGKTTTSALLTHLFIEAGKEPAYMIGGAFQKTNESYSMGGGKNHLVIYEGDEYNCAFFDQAPKFLRYNSTSAIITSLEQDHVDLYPTFEDYKQAFQFLVDELPENGFLLVHESAVPHLVLERCRAEVVVYGSQTACDARYIIDTIDEHGTTFTIHSSLFSSPLTIQTPLFGSYNTENATAVAMLAFLEGLSSEEICAGMRTFTGTHERQEILGLKKDGTIVIRDYAHHPTAVTVTLEGMRQHYPGKRLVVIFEPTSASSRRKIFEDRYVEALLGADIAIIINPPLNPQSDPATFFDASTVSKVLTAKGKSGYAAQSLEEALSRVRELHQPDDVVIFMSSGDMNDIDHLFLEK